MATFFPSKDDLKKDAEAAQDSIPEDFWLLPETFIEDPDIRELYTVLYKQLLSENPDRDTIETMMIERAAALYTYMRSVEASGDYGNTSGYRQLVSLWHAMSSDLRKTRTANVDESKIREDIAREYIMVLNSSLKGFDPEIQATIRRRVASAFESMV